MRRVALIIAVVALVAATVAFAVTRGPSPGTAGGSTPAPGADAAPGATTPAADAAGDASVSGTAAAARATTRPPSVRLSQIPGSYSQPVYVTAPRGDTSRLFIVEKTGAIRIVKDGAVLQQPFLDISAQVSRGSEQGLLSMAFHPRYASNGRFYVNYTNANGDTRVVRYRVSSDGPGQGGRLVGSRRCFASTSPTATTTAGSCSSARTGASGSAWATAAAAATPSAAPRTPAAGWARCCASTWARPRPG